MPIISRFNGISIRMYFQQAEHNPPHIHVSYSGTVAVVGIRDKEILEGELPGKVMNLIRKWINLHEEELLQIWDSQVFLKIPPLE